MICTKELRHKERFISKVNDLWVCCERTKIFEVHEMFALTSLTNKSRITTNARDEIYVFWLKLNLMLFVIEMTRHIFFISMTCDSLRNDDFHVVAFSFDQTGYVIIEWFRVTKNSFGIKILVATKFVVSIIQITHESFFLFSFKRQMFTSKMHEIFCYFCGFFLWLFFDPCSLWFVIVGSFYGAFVCQARLRKSTEWWNVLHSDTVNWTLTYSPIPILVTFWASP